VVIAGSCGRFSEFLSSEILGLTLKKTDGEKVVENGA